MKKYLIGVDPAVDGYRPDVFIVDYPSLITNRVYSKEEADRITLYSQQIGRMIRQKFRPINEIRKEKIEEIINRL